MIVVGLTGNYGSGKSTVAGMFKQLGATTIDADEIVRQLLDEPEVIKEISDAFGEEMVSEGRVDKKRLADWVFRDAHARITLEDILHPLVFHRVKDRLAALSKENDHVAIIEATVIFERGYQGRFDRIITVYAVEETSHKRLKAKGVSDVDVSKRLATQLPADIKMRGSDFVIDNDQGLEKTREQVSAIYQTLLSSERKDGNN